MTAWTDWLLVPAIGAAERGRVPDGAVRWGIRRLCRSMLEASVDPAGIDALVEELRRDDVARVPDSANEQHYEVPTEFFREVLGAHMKYSCCHWSAETRTLDEAEAEALEITARRAGIDDDLDVLELGCGWGSLTIWMAEHYPRASITAVTNSATQAAFVTERAARGGHRNVRVLRADMNELRLTETYDRVVSVEMFEHMRNYEILLARIAEGLRPEGTLFVHVFRHRTRPYCYGTEAPADWMGRHFFRGGIMPSRDLLSRFDRHLRVRRTWDWSGEHYQKTSEAWLRRLDEARSRVLTVLERDRGPESALVWFHRWRLFFLACAELFGWRDGQEWGVSHYLFEPSSEGGR